VQHFVDRVAFEHDPELFVEQLHDRRPAPRTSAVRGGSDRPRVQPRPQAFVLVLVEARLGPGTRVMVKARDVLVVIPLDPSLHAPPRQLQSVHDLRRRPARLRHRHDAQPVACLPVGFGPDQLV
jgi:hypothetical protein